jgi:hypothetical protein
VLNTALDRVLIRRLPAAFGAALKPGYFPAAPQCWCPEFFALPAGRSAHASALIGGGMAAGHGTGNAAGAAGSFSFRSAPMTRCWLYAGVMLAASSFSL